MNTPIQTKTYAAPPVCEPEILRYAGCRGAAGEETAALLRDCLREVEGRLRYIVCFRELPFSAEDGRCELGAFSAASEKLARRLAGSARVFVFAATVGVELDRLIAKYGRLSPARALMLQAFGAERIEALCDAFCADLERETGLRARPRFSPGYGDLPLGMQKDIFAVLECEKRIGLFLNESLLMSPSKSVTAFVGLDAEEGTAPRAAGCAACARSDCAFRRP